MKDPAPEPTSPALSPYARAQEEYALALIRGSLEVVQQLRAEALDPKLDQRARIRACRTLFEAAISMCRTERARIIPAGKQRATVEGPPLIARPMGLPPRDPPRQPPV